MSEKQPILELQTSSRLELEPVKLGKDVRLEYIPFSELIIPWEICINSSGRMGRYDAKQLSVFTHGTVATESSKALKTMKQEDLEALRYSIGRFGLLKPFEVAELPEQLDFFFGKGKYIIIDGQRRYFAIRELLRLPTEYDEREQKESLRSQSRHDKIHRAEVQAQKQVDRLSIRDYVLVPCLVFPYRTYLQMMRHRIEDDRFSEKPSRDSLEIAERMRHEGIPDLSPDDLSKLWETRRRIGEERRAIENTLDEIRNRMKRIDSEEGKNQN